MAKVIIEPPAEIDMATAPSLTEQVLASDPDQTIVVDLTRVSFCDSTGLAALMVAREHVEHGSGRLVLRNPSASILRLLMITQLEDAFEIEGPSDAAT